MSKVSTILKLPLRLLIFAIFLASFYTAYTDLVGWSVPVIYTIIIGLYLAGVFLGKKPKDAVPEDIGTRETVSAIITEDPTEQVQELREVEDGRE